MKASFKDIFLCKIGIHGPHWYALEVNVRNTKVSPLRRKCLVCQKEWSGRRNHAKRYKAVDWEEVIFKPDIKGEHKCLNSKQ